MRYYPLNRVKTDQKTDGGRFTLSGVEYRGDYYETYDGNYFTGKNPTQGLSQKLQEYQLPETGPNSKDKNLNIGKIDLDSTEAITYKLAKGTPVETGLFKTPQPYYPQPTDVDYKRKSITRYFAKKRDRPGYVVEISKETHDSLKNADSVYDYVTYETISIFWQIAGSLYDENTVDRNRRVAGIISTNRRLVEAKERIFAGLEAYIGKDYIKYAKPSS